LVAQGPAPVPAVEGQELTNATLATFTADDSSVSAGDLQALAWWGDDSDPAYVTVTAAAGGGSGFVVTGSHTYDAADSYGLAVLILDHKGSPALTGLPANWISAA